MDFTFYISQGSVATQLRCGGMFNNHFIPNLWLCGLLFSGPPSSISLSYAIAYSTAVASLLLGLSFDRPTGL